VGNKDRRQENMKTLKKQLLIVVMTCIVGFGLFVSMAYGKSPPPPKLIKGCKPNQILTADQPPPCITIPLTCPDKPKLPPRSPPINFCGSILICDQTYCSPLYLNTCEPAGPGEPGFNCQAFDYNVPVLGPKCVIKLLPSGIYCWTCESIMPMTLTYHSAGAC
jgi:hypothetical protein